MKPIPFHYSLKVAEQVRRAVNCLNTSNAIRKDANVECFDNCREQGYVLSLMNGMVAFAQYRCSDEIVVYCYTNTAFSQNLPAEEIDWQDRKYFRYDEVEQAARYILERAEKYAG